MPLTKDKVLLLRVASGRYADARVLYSSQRRSLLPRLPVYFLYSRFLPKRARLSRFSLINIQCNVLAARSFVRSFSLLDFVPTVRPLPRHNHSLIGRVPLAFSPFPSFPFLSSSFLARLFLPWLRVRRMQTLRSIPSDLGLLMSKSSWLVIDLLCAAGSYSSPETFTPPFIQVFCERRKLMIKRSTRVWAKVCKNVVGSLVLLTKKQKGRNILRTLELVALGCVLG